jgi:hypothetical protein
MICDPENGSGARDSPEISRICDPENRVGIRNLRGISRTCDPETGSGFAICAEFLEYATRKPGRGFTNCPEFLRDVTRLGGSLSQQWDDSFWIYDLAYRWSGILPIQSSCPDFTEIKQSPCQVPRIFVTP